MQRTLSTSVRLEGKRLVGWFRSRYLAVSVIGCLALGASTALATSSSDSTNPDCTVSASLSPDTLSHGGTVHVSASVKNNTRGKASFVVKVMMKLPTGQTLHDSIRLRLNSGQTQSFSYSFAVPQNAPKGTFEFTVSASDAHGTSSATATTTVQ